MTTTALLRRSLLAALTLAVGACSTVHGGYPNHVEAASLQEPGKPASDDRTMYLNLIDQMQQQGAYYASLAHIDAYRQRFGNSPELQRLQGEALRATGQDAAASVVYQDMLHGPQAAAAWHGLGLIAAHQKRYVEAVTDLGKASQLEPINASYLNDLGFAQLAANHLADAQQPLAKAAELDQHNPKVIANLALWAMLSGNPAQAQDIMQRAQLPQATRDAVSKLAIQLRMQAALAQDGSHDSNTDAMSTPARDIPSPLLKRFATTQEAQP